MEQDLKPIFNKKLIKGFDTCNDHIKHEIDKMNDWKAIARQKVAREKKHKKEKAMHRKATGMGDDKTDHAGLIGLYTTLNATMISKVFNHKKYTTSKSISLTKK